MVPATTLAEIPVHRGRAKLKEYLIRTGIKHTIKPSAHPPMISGAWVQVILWSRLRESSCRFGVEGRGNSQGAWGSETAAMCVGGITTCVKIEAKYRKLSVYMNLYGRRFSACVEAA